MAGQTRDSTRPHNRRQLFRQGFGKLLAPLASFLEERLPVLVPRFYLRPPGALPEKDFLDMCYRCGNCIDACATNAIRRLSVGDPEADGTPYIDPDIVACAVCTTLECTAVCPSGALRRVTDKHEIHMGRARVDTNLCFRGRQECTICVENCPIGPDAIRINDRGHVQVSEAGCIGCGRCRQVCPTYPRAITIEPW